MRLAIVTMFVALLLSGCGRQQQESVKQEAPQVAAPAPVPAAEARKASSVESVASPAGKGAAEPFLFAAGDAVVMSWLEPGKTKGTSVLRFSRYEGGRWAEPRTIIESGDLFANWADFPSVVQDASGALFAHWLQKSGGDTYAYDVKMAVSRDGGAAWGEPFLLNRDGKQREHGFVSLVPLAGGGVGAAWLDGRKMAAGDHDHGGGDMTLRYATVDAAGAISGDVELDDRTCECCSTGMAMTKQGPVVVYRDRSPEEIRDISSVRLGKGGWSKPRPVRQDGWKIAGCPVNGPQADAAGDVVATAWFTAAQGKQHVYAAFSADGGETFGEPVVVDDGRPVGRVDVVMLDSSRALVTWLEQTDSAAEVRARVVSSGSGPEASVKIADSSTARGSGFPRIARAGSEVWFAWVAVDGDAKDIRLARASF